MTANPHLPDHLASMCINKQQLPLNPHKQRLLSAANRAAKVDTDTKPKEPKKAPKKPKEAKPKEPKVPKAQKTKETKQSDTKKDEKGAAAKDAYQAAKKAFMDKLLSCIN